MSRTRKVILVVAVFQLLVGLLLYFMVTSLESPNDFTVLSAYVLLAVAIVSFVTQYNGFGRGLVFLGNCFVAGTWTLGFVQRAPDYLAERGFGLSLLTGMSLAIVIPCLINASSVNKLAREKQESSGNTVEEEESDQAPS